MFIEQSTIGEIIVDTRFSPNSCKMNYSYSNWSSLYLRSQDLRPQDLIRWKTGRDGFTLDDYFKYSGNCNYLNVHYQ